MKFINIHYMNGITYSGQITLTRCIIQKYSQYIEPKNKMLLMLSNVLIILQSHCNLSENEIKIFAKIKLKFSRKSKRRHEQVLLQHSIILIKKNASTM